MEILGKLTFRSLVTAGAIEISSIILLCYGLAVKEGHVEPWLPTISACGVHPPEVFPFRYGFVICTAILAVEAIAVYSADKPYSKSTLNLTLGLVAAFCLGVVGVINSHENDTIHTAAAVIFFVTEDILMVIQATQSVGSTSNTSLAVRMVCSVVACLSTIARLFLMYDPGFFGHAGIALALVEWTNTIAMVVYQLNFATDFNGDYLAEVKNVHSKMEAGVPEVKVYLENQADVPEVKVHLEDQADLP